MESQTLGFPAERDCAADAFGHKSGRGRVGMDPYLVEGGWHSSSQRATSTAISPPSRPAQAPCPISTHTGDRTKEAPQRDKRRTSH
eukprot:superscaffoldBa00000812_g7378